MAKEQIHSFGDAIRERRHQLDLTQEEVARLIGTSVPYVGHLEAGKRHPSDAVVSCLADALGLDRSELYFLANPHARDLIEPARHREGASAWDQFRLDERLRHVHKISDVEMAMLSQVALMGEVRSVRDFIYILNTVRQALVR